MRTLLALILALLLAAPAWAGGAASFADPRGDVAWRTGAGYQRFSAPTAPVCEADAVDILGLTTADDGEFVTLRLQLADMDVPARCGGVPVRATATNYHVDLIGVGHPYQVWTLGGDYCSGGAWDCISIVGPEGGHGTPAGAEGRREGDTWVIRFPLVGHVEWEGWSYDLRGLAFTVEADAQQHLPAPYYLVLEDELQAGLVTL